MDKKTRFMTHEALADDQWPVAHAYELDEDDQNRGVAYAHAGEGRLGLVDTLGLKNNIDLQRDVGKKREQVVTECPRQTHQKQLLLLLMPSAYATELPGDSADGKRLHEANCKAVTTLASTPASSDSFGLWMR